MNHRRLSLLLAFCATLAGCGGDSLAPNQSPPPSDTTTTPTPTVTSCTSPVAINLSVGSSTVVDPATGGGCVRFPSAGLTGAEYLYTAVATNGQETTSGISTSYEVRGTPSTLTASTGGLSLPSAIDPTLNAFAPKSSTVFHAFLRNRERILAASPGAISFDRALLNANVVVVPPTVGSERTFHVCANVSCSSFVDVTGTAKHVGPKGAIYLDNTVPGDSYTQTEIDSVGFLFDNYLYPLDTTSFGRESDLDNNGVVVVLLTDQVNALSPSCNSTGSVILGFFYGNDLIPSNAGSNAGEIFYGLVPDPNNTSCTISHQFASLYLAPTFIHEFQHMISFNQHVLVRGGLSEDTWLNEGLSHYAEELGGRNVPDQYCDNNDCLTQYAVGDIQNAYGYLEDPEAYFLVEPGSSNGSLEERGANWLFVRWLVDQFGADLTGAAFTRSLVATSKLGAANVAAVTGVPFATLVPQWQLANYLDDLPGFVPLDSRLRYSSWNFHATFSSLNAQDPAHFPRPYPLVPDSTLTGVYDRKGTLRAGSGPHVRIVQSAQSGTVTMQLTDSLRRTIGTGATPRVGIARIR